MKEHIVHAFVLGRTPHKEHDRTVDLYTKELGRVCALARGLRKITSKLAGHLQPLSFAQVRLVEKNSFQVVDAKERAALPSSPRAVALAEFIRATTAELEPDVRLWYDLVRAAGELRTKGNFSYLPLIRDLGFDPRFASCEMCGEKKVKYFSPSNLSFFCAQCVARTHALKPSLNAVELIDLHVA